MKKVIVNTRYEWDRNDKFSFVIVEDDGAIKWESNGNYLMNDTMERIITNGFTGFSVEATRAKREKQNDEFIAEYRKNHKTSQEELAEMRSVFGKGTAVVNILTGERIVL